MICRASRKSSMGVRLMTERSRLTQGSIVFVHGLRGHPRYTWMSSHKTGNEPSNWRQNLKPAFKSSARSSESDCTKDGTSARQGQLFWPHEYLVKDIPQARVWTYGYNADVVGDAFKGSNLKSVSQHGQDLALKLERDVDNEVDLSRFEEAEPLS